MKINSLSRQTDLIFSNFSGNVEYKENHVLIQTPSNPWFHWGNYIIFDKPPTSQDYIKWIELFDKSFPYYLKPHHYTFTWDKPGQKGDPDLFIKNGFILDSGTSLIAHKLIPPNELDESILIRKLKTDDDWSHAVELQILCAESQYTNASHNEFKMAQMKEYKKMSQAGLGFWLGAFDGNKLVGNLGIYSHFNIARYQNVGTHPEYRNLGICKNLVFEAGKTMLSKNKVDSLIIEADPDYHAIKVYESVGFKKLETNYSLSWWDKN